MAATHHAAILNNYYRDLQASHFTVEPGLNNMVKLVFLAKAVLGFTGAVANRGKDALDRVGCPGVLPVFSWEVKEGQQLLAVFHQFGYCLPVLHTTGFDEDVEGCVGLLLRLGHPDVLQIRPGLFVDGPGHGSQHVRCLVDPASLFTGLGVNITQSSPEPGLAIADGQFRRHSQTPLLEPFEQVAPAVRVLSEPVRDCQETRGAPIVDGLLCLEDARTQR